MEQVNNLKVPGIRARFLNKYESEQEKDVILMQQVHGSTVLIADEVVPELVNGTLPIDGLVTTLRGLKLTVKTADCIPLLMVETERNIIAAVHVGWKSALEGIVENALLSMLYLGGRLANIRAGLGPSLQKESFPVSKEMMYLYPKTEYRFFTTKEEGIFFDAPAYVRYRLERNKVTNIESIDINTYRDDNYYSYRKNPEEKRRQYSVIEIL